MVQIWQNISFVFDVFDYILRSNVIQSSSLPKAQYLSGAENFFAGRTQKITDTRNGNIKHGITDTRN